MSKQFGWIARGVALAAAYGLVGCTHLSVTADRVRSDPSHALSGVTYSLPMLQYEMAVTRTLAACPQRLKIGDQAIDVWSDDLAVDLGVTATATQIPGERYRIDYSKLDSWMKTTTFAVEYQPGGTDLLKSVNVSVDDHTGEVIGNVVKAGVAVAGIAVNPVAGVALTGALAGQQVKTDGVLSQIPVQQVGKSLVEHAKEQERKRQAKADANSRAALIELIKANAGTTNRPLLACTEEAVALTAKRATLAGQMKTKNAELVKVTWAVEALSKIGSVRGLDAEGREELRKQTQRLGDLFDAASEDRDAIGKLEERLGATDKAVWPKTFLDHGPEPVAPLSPEERTAMARLFATQPKVVVVADPNKLAAALVESKRVEEFRRVAKDLVDRYVDRDGIARVFTTPNPAGCRKDVALDTCLTSLTTVNAAITAVPTDTLAACGRTTRSPECIGLHPRSPAAGAGGAAAGVSRRGTLAATMKTLPALVDARDDADHAGLFVRLPVRATLVICRAPSRDEPTSHDGICAEKTRSLVKDDKVLTPQLGQLRYFRLVNQMFSNNGLMLSLTKDGAIERFQYANSKAIAQGLTAAVADAAAQVRADDKERDAAADPLAVAEKAVALKTAQATLAGFATVKEPTELEAIQLEKARADLALVKAQAAFTAAQTALAVSGGD